MSPALALLPVLLPAAAGAGALLLASRPRSAPAADGVAAAGLLAALAATAFLWRAAGRAEISLLDGAYVLDRFGLAFGAVVLGAALLASLLAAEAAPRSGLPRGETQALLLFSTTGAVAMVTAGDLLSFFLGLEVMSVPAYALTGFRRADGRSSEAAMKYFLLGAFASGFVLYGIALAYGVAGTTRLDAVGAALSEASRSGGADPRAALGRVAAALVLVGLLFKVGAVPFHMWVPDAYQGAPTAVTAFMSSAVKAAALGGLLRLAATAFAGPAAEAEGAGGLLGVLALVTMTLGNVAALATPSLKRLLAWSSIAHAGYALVGVAAVAAARDDAARTAAASSVAIYALTYGVSVAGAFGVVAALERADRGDVGIEEVEGLAARRPWLAAALTLFLLSLAGLPPTAGFFGKYTVFSAAVAADRTPLAVAGVVNSVVALGYYLRVPLAVYGGRAADAEPAPPAGGGWLPLGVAATGTVWLGMGPSLTPLLPGLTDVLAWSWASAAGLFA